MDVYPLWAAHCAPRLWARFVCCLATLKDEAIPGRATHVRHLPIEEFATLPLSACLPPVMPVCHAPLATSPPLCLSTDLGAPCPVMAPLWVDQWLVGRVEKRHPEAKLENMNRCILQQLNFDIIVKVVCMCVCARACVRLRRPSTACVRGVCQPIPPVVIILFVCVCVCVCVSSSAASIPTDRLCILLCRERNLVTNFSFPRISLSHIMLPRPNERSPVSCFQVQTS